MMKNRWKVATTVAIAVGMTAGLAVPASAATIGDQPAQTTFEGDGGTFSISAVAAGSGGIAARSEQSNSGEDKFFTAAADRSGSARWDLELPAGAQASVITNEQGAESVVLTNSEGDFLGGIATPEDAPATTYAVEGATVVQTLVEHNTADNAVITMAANSDWYRRAWVTTNSRGYIVNADPTALGRQQIAWSIHYLHVRHLKRILGDQAYRVNYNIEQQFVCHVAGAWFPTGVYNMESWQPELYWQLIANPIDRCNRIK